MPLSCLDALHMIIPPPKHTQTHILATTRADLSGASVLAGTLPAAWANLTRLQSLAVSLNGSGSGPLPASWGNMSALRSLSISDATFSASGATLDAWAAVGSLARLVLRNVTFVAPAVSLPASWSSQLPKLSELVLDRVTGLLGGLPLSWLPAFPQLASLQLKALPDLNISLADVSALLGSRTAGSINGSSSSSSAGGLIVLSLEGLRLSGPLPPALFTQTR